MRCRTGHDVCGVWRAKRAEREVLRRLRRAAPDRGGSARRSDADATFGLVPIGLVHAAFPGIRRTAFRFRDGEFCGCNLYALLSTKGYEVLTAWTRVEAQRKRPWKMVRLLGYGTLLRFFLGRLALADLTGILFSRLGLRVRPVFLTDPAAGFDVDTPEQRIAAEAFLLSKAS